MLLFSWLGISANDPIMTWHMSNTEMLDACPQRRENTVNCYEGWKVVAIFFALFAAFRQRTLCKDIEKCSNFTVKIFKKFSLLKKCLWSKIFSSLNV